MVVTSIEHSVLDGSIVRISGPNLDLSKPVSSIVTTVVGNSRVEFTVFRRGPGAAAMAYEAAGVRLDEEYAYRGGSLQVGRALDARGRVDFLVGVWEGRAWSVYAPFYGGGAANLMAVLDLLSLDETEVGLVLIPRNTRIRYEQAPELTKVIPGVGLLVMSQLTQQVARDLPRWPGTGVPGGELFVDDIPGAGQRYYVLVSPTAKATVMPSPEAAGDTVPSRLVNLNVTWRPPA
jgi:hypothetical protein